MGELLRYSRVFLLCWITIGSLTACNTIVDVILDGTSDSDCGRDDSSVTFKKVAYWDSDDMTDIDVVDYDQLTHLIYGYLQVNADGSLVDFDESEENDFTEMISYAQSEGVEVLVSIGGTDAGTSSFRTIAGSSSLTNTFVANVIDFLEYYDLQGADLNWQTPQSDAQGELFEKLIEELSAELWGNGYLLTASLASGEDEDIADVIDSSVFDYIDFANIRAFDSEDSDDLHSSVADAQNAVDYWTGRCLVQNKLVLGIPFYSAGDAVESYNDIVEDDPDNACVDETAYNGNDINYNGITTVIEKTEYAMDHTGGIMIQSLQQDAYDNSDYLLLNVIDKTESGNGVDICN
ncbi:glycosyl hydrolase family 18 protein [Psychromonas sp.]|uniref:glycosyl hydrolase family 18 protein n=1 Tax=Psychromonas sp. TaxID=1884585 RepID=UPI0035659F59